MATHLRPRAEPRVLRSTCLLALPGALLYPIESAAAVAAGLGLVLTTLPRWGRRAEPAWLRGMIAP